MRLFAVCLLLFQIGLPQQVEANTRARSQQIRQGIRQAIKQKRGVDWVRSGWTADAFLLKKRSGEGKRWVYKRIKPTIPSGNLMPQPDAKMRTTFRDMTLFVVKELGQSPHFRSFKHLLPETRSVGRFAMLQELGKGIAYEKLSKNAQQLADTQIVEIKKLAKRALPWVEIDVNKGNILFDKRGHAKSLFDPAGGWWARLLGDKLRHDDRAWQVDNKHGPFRVANSIALRVTDGDLKFGDAWLVANVERGNAYIVKHGFKMAYQTPHALSGLRPLSDILGPPRSEESQIRPNVYEQKFERGVMRWDPRHHVTVSLSQ